MFPVIITCQLNLHLITSWKDVGVCLAPLLVCNFTKPFPAGRYQEGEGFGYARLCVHKVLELGLLLLSITNYIRVRQESRVSWGYRLSEHSSVLILRITAMNERRLLYCVGLAVLA